MSDAMFVLISLVAFLFYVVAGVVIFWAAEWIGQFYDTEIPSLLYAIAAMFGVHGGLLAHGTYARYS